MVYTNYTIRQISTKSNGMRIAKHNKAVTLVELLIAMTIMVIIMAAIAPQFRAIRNSWATSEASSNLIQNSRVLQEHIVRNLSTAREIVSVSADSVNLGFIIFKDSADIQKRYLVSGGYVLFGNLGSEEQLAGPISKFQVSCFSLDDFVTATTDGNDIRLVEIETIFPHNTGIDRTFLASVYLRTSTDGCDLVGHWKLDESAGTTAADSSVNSNHGTVYNGPVWTAGQLGNALDFDGSNDYVSLPIGSVISSLTNCTITAWIYWNGGGAWQRIWDFGTGVSVNMFLTTRNVYNDRPRFAITTIGWWDEEQIDAPDPLPTGEWHHIVVTIDADNHTHKMYINGSYVNENTSAYLTPADLGNTNRNYIARSNYAASPYFDPYLNGMVDDVRIYNRVLSATEIEQLANTLRYRGFTEQKVSLANTSITIDTPAGDEDDLLIAAVATDGSTTISPSPPLGWTIIDQGSNGPAVTLGAWWRIAEASEPANHTFTWTGSEQAYGWIMRFSGQRSTSSPIEASTAGDYTSSTPTSPPVTTSANNCIILRLGAFDNGTITVGSTGLSGHTDITMDASAVSGSGAVSILGSWTEGTSHSRPSGTNRALIFIAHAEDNDDPSISLNNDIRYGGQLMTKVVERVVGTTANSRAYVTAYRLDEAGIAAASGSTFTGSWNQPPDSAGYSSVFLQNVNQANLVGDFSSNGVTNTDTISTSSSLSTSSADIVIYAATSSSTGSYTPRNGFTEELEVTISSADGTGGYKAATGAAETPRVTHSVGSDVRHVIIGLVVQGYVSGGTVSGGAGYTIQATAGSSGESNFSLTASQAARTLTIGIAPNPIDDDCQITP